MSATTPRTPQRRRRGADKENVTHSRTAVTQACNTHSTGDDDHDAFIDEMLSWSSNKSDGSHSTQHATVSSARAARPLGVHATCNTTTTTAAAAACKHTIDAPQSRGDDEDSNNNSSTTTVTQGQTDGSGCRSSRVPPVLTLPDEVHARLYAHQRDGVQWLYAKHCTARACLLADEMGLGKTVQVCVLLGCLYARGDVRTTILVAPASLLPVWQAALQSWGRLAAPVVEVVHRGTAAQRATRWRKLGYGLPCVLLTSYGVLRHDAAAMSRSLVDYVVFDEVQLVKEPRTRVADAACALSARHKIGLTGTPLANSFTDIWAIYHCLDHSILGSTRAAFAAVNGTLMHGNERDASAAAQRDAAAALTRLRAAVAPYMLRRTKAQLGGDVLASRKHDVVVWVRLSAVQERQYVACLAAAAAAATTTTSSSGSDSATMHTSNDDKDDSNNNSSSNNGTALLLLTTLQQICSHPWLCLTTAAFAEALSRPFVAPCADVGDVCSGHKLLVCMALLTRSVNAGHKVLVFARSRRLLQLLEVLLRQWLLPYTRLDGDTSSEQRQRIVDAYNTDAHVRVCLLTTQVGGVGLTFTAASCVIVLEPSWSASADAQAVDRAHRIGQERDVCVYRLVTCGTVEEKVYRNQIYKTMAATQATSMARAVYTPRHDDGDGDGDDNAVDDVTTMPFRYFTHTQLRRMFALGELQRSATARQLRVLHPTATLPADVLAMTCAVPHVCDVSNHGCVLREPVADAHAAYRDDDGEEDEAAAEVVDTRNADEDNSEQQQALLHSPCATPPSRDAGGDDTTMSPRQRRRLRSCTAAAAAATTTTMATATICNNMDSERKSISACRPAQQMRVDDKDEGDADVVTDVVVDVQTTCRHDGDVRARMSAHEQQQQQDDEACQQRGSDVASLSLSSSLCECVEPPDD